MEAAWTRKHAPQRLADFVGQDAPLEAIRKHVAGFRRGGKPLLLHGPTGTGKTAAAHALARDLDLEVVELNASDTRNKGAIEPLLKAALGQQSLFFRGKLILIDEADGLSGQADRGGAKAVADLIKGSSYPVIITANDLESGKVKPLKKGARIVEFPALSAASIVTLITRVAAAEGIDTTEETLAALARRAGGDARAAVNDLQCLSSGNRLRKEDLDALGDRERQEELRQALLRIFKTTAAEVALPALDNVAEDLDEVFLWIAENLPREYSKAEDLARAFDALSEADRFFGRIRRWQYYRFYVYCYNLLTAGIALAKSERYPGVREYERSKRPLMIWMANQRNAKRKAVAEKLAAATHTSARRAYAETHYLKAMAQGKRAALVEALGLSEDEAAWLRS